CGDLNAPERLTCGQCGQVLDAAPPADAAASSGTTVGWSGPPSALLRRGEPRPAVEVAKLFGMKNRLVLGRGADCDVTLAHPTVSRRHAELERLPDGRLRLYDFSRNGVFVEGRRLEEAHVLEDGERVGIGPFLFALQAGVIYSFDSSRRLRLEARALERVVPLPGRHTRKLLDDISLVVEPGEFVVLMGPSGSGKSTLMDCLNGRRRATGGRVLANGEDFYRHFDNFRQSLGYVPQKDIVHADLSVYRALYYTARLRLPTDTGPSELRRRVEEVLQEMKLEGRQRHTPIGRLSGGEVKRVSLGAELLARPSLLYIDEATSGLDAGTDAQMMQLFRQLADQGRSILCITHSLENVEQQCHLILVLTEGRLVYYGPPAEAPGYFGVKRITHIYDRLRERDAAAWQAAFRDSDYYGRYVAGRLAGAEAPVIPPAPAEAETEPGQEPETTPGVYPLPAEAVPGLVPGSEETARPYHPPLWHQFRVLTARYAELIWGDRRNFWLLLLQAPAVGLILLLVSVRMPFQEKIPTTRRLDAAERQTLEDLQKVLRDGQGVSQLTAAQVQALNRIELPPAPGGEAATVGDLIRDLQKLGKEGDQKQLDKTVDALLKTSLPVLPTGTMVQPKHTYTVLMLLVIVVFWFGCNNAGKEIVKEEPVYARERAVNLGILPYLGSKFLVQSVIAAVQVLQLMLLIYGPIYLLHALFPSAGFQLPPADYHLGYVRQYGVLVLLATVGVAAGLLLSACVSSPDRANALLPYVLIPQIVLADGFVAIEGGLLYWLAMLTSPVYWAFRTIRRGVTAFPEGFPFHRSYNDNPLLGCAALAAMLVVLLAATAWFMRRKDVVAR
ncbi:MAG TPA: ATP-binding cassette domain-containing protein, partial [Gemmataceae bacterium]|nr:ATP-binding cassette domain-containing protein [Gemmataceae bacterium]